MMSSRFDAKRLRKVPASIFLGVAFMCLAMASVGLSSCSSSSAPASNPGKDAAPLELADATVPCSVSSDAGDDPPNPGPDLTQGIPYASIADAEAWAVCNYFARCSPLAGYLVNQCEQNLATYAVWVPGECNGEGSCFQLTRGFDTLLSRAQLAQEVQAGLLTYQPMEETLCLKEIQAQSCHGPFPAFNTPHCVQAYACAQDAGSPEGGASDAGTTEGGAPFVCDYAPAVTGLTPCTTNADCEVDGSDGNTICAFGYCGSSACGELDVDGTGCPTFVAAGAPCDSESTFLGAGDSFTTQDGAKATKTCSPGLTCAGLAASTLGTCSAGGEVGAPCTESAIITGCNYGLLCQCGECRFPPNSGPCDLTNPLSCVQGESYCASDPTNPGAVTGTCQPVQQLNGDCSATSLACAPNLLCTNFTCATPH